MEPPADSKISDARESFLKRKAAAEGIALPDDVATFLAASAPNIRALDGLLIRLVAVASLTGCDVSMPLAADVVNTDRASRRE